MNKKLFSIIAFIILCISLLGITYGYWSEQLTLKGNANLTLQVEVVDTANQENEEQVTQEESKDEKKEAEDKDSAAEETEEVIQSLQAFTENTVS
jgi:sortase (surface protein transpeptidase)